MSRSFAIAVFALTTLFALLFLVYPILHTVKEAFVGPDGGFTLAYIGNVLTNPIYREGLLNALLLAIASTGLAFLLAVPLSVIADRFQFPFKGAMGSLVLVPLILPPFVGAIGVKQILGVNGSFNAVLTNLGLMDPAQPFDWLGEGRFWGVAIMNALHLYPILYLNVTAALANLDPAMEEAAENLGATWWRRFRRVILPLTMPGIFAGGTIVFIWSFTELGVPLIFDYTRVTSVQIFDGIKDLSGNPFPYALVVVMLVSTTLLYAASKLTLGRVNFTMNTRATMARAPRRLGWFSGWLATLLFLSVTAIAILPHAGVVLMSLADDWYGTVLPSAFTTAHYSEALGDPLVVPSIQNSLFYALIATGIDVVLGLAIAYVVVRTDLPGRQFLDALAMLPLAVPGLVLAFGYLAMTREGEFFSFLRAGENPTLILIIAYATRRLPYVVRSAAAGYQQTSVTLEEAARNLGCPPLKAMRKVTLPLIAANLIAGALLAFSFAMLEVSDSLLLAQQATFYPITKAIYQLFNQLGNGHFLACALGVWAMVFLGVTITGASMVLGRKLGALFRV
jgi:iron(III) transport system permease protein